MTNKNVARTAWGSNASSAYATAKQYGGTALLWTFLSVLALSICVIVVAHNWRSVSQLTEYWSPSQTAEPISTKSAARLETDRKSDSDDIRLNNSQATGNQP